MIWCVKGCINRQKGCRDRQNLLFIARIWDGDCFLFATSFNHFFGNGLNEDQLYTNSGGGYWEKTNYQEYFDDEGNKVDESYDVILYENYEVIDGEYKGVNEYDRTTIKKSQEKFIKATGCTSCFEEG